MKDIELKIRDIILSKETFKKSFKEQTGLNPTWIKNSKRYNFSGYSWELQKDLDKRVKKIIELFK
jgi:hypothetical protein